VLVSGEDGGVGAPGGPDGAGGDRTGVLRRLGPADLEACLALDGVALQGWWSRRQWEEELAHPDAIGIGGWRGPELVAMAWGRLGPDGLEVLLVGVDPARRRQGWGRRVLGELCRRAAAAGATDATLEVATGNRGAQALYRRLGFSTVALRRGYYRGGEDALLQRREGSPDPGARS
jgi:ribosomal-protein-alanine N-acetyltransferase